MTWGGCQRQIAGDAKREIPISGGGHRTLLIVAPNHQAVTRRFILYPGTSVTKD